VPLARCRFLGLGWVFGSSICKQGQGPGRAVPSGSSMGRSAQSRSVPAAWVWEGPVRPPVDCEGADGEAARPYSSGFVLQIDLKPPLRKPSWSGCRSMLQTADSGRRWRWLIGSLRPTPPQPLHAPHTSLSLFLLPYPHDVLHTYWHFRVPSHFCRGHSRGHRRQHVHLPGTCQAFEVATKTNILFMP
jgi:hypothetical protein